jgi:hypothetical protein
MSNQGKFVAWCATHNQHEPVEWQFAHCGKSALICPHRMCSSGARQIEPEAVLRRDDVGKQQATRSVQEAMAKSANRIIKSNNYSPRTLKRKHGRRPHAVCGIGCC